MTLTALAPPPIQLEYKHLVNEVLWGRLVHRIMKDEGLSLQDAERTMDAALGFLQLCADHSEHRFSPTERVDIGWHTFILYTRSYAAFCETLGGGYIHHEPNDLPGFPQDTPGPAATVAFMRLVGMKYDPVMWETSATDCTVDCDGGRGNGPNGDGGTGGCS
jgi:hypothetical protein